MGDDDKGTREGAAQATYELKADIKPSRLVGHGHGWGKAALL